MSVRKYSTTLEFIEYCNITSDIEAAITDFRSLIAEYGISAAACGAWEGIGQQRANRFFFNSWPDAWLQLYAEKELFSADPFVEEARRAMTSFLWSEIEDHRPLTPRGKEIYTIAREFGWREVIGIPIHGPAGYQGFVSLASMEDIKLSVIDRTCLDMTSRVIHEKCRKVVGFGVAPESTPKLTPRELECMQWVAVGKTDWEIAQVIGISASTVHFHVESAKRKLGMTSRTEVVARLTLYGLI